MKKILSSLLSLLLLLSLFVLPVKATGTIHDIDELDFTVAFPDGWSVFTRDLDEYSTTLLTLIGFPEEEFLAWLQENDTYLVALKDDLTAEISIDIWSEDADNFTTKTDRVLDDWASGDMKQRYKELGVEIEEYKIYKNEQTKFVNCYYTDEEGDATLEGLTCCDGTALRVALTSYAGTITSEQEEEFLYILDNVSFEYAPKLNSFTVKLATLWESSIGVKIIPIIIIGIISKLFSGLFANRRKKNSYKAEENEQNWEMGDDWHIT